MSDTALTTLLGQVGMAGIFAAFCWYLISSGIPALVRDFRADLTELVKNFRADMAAERAEFRAELAEERKTRVEQHKTCMDGMERMTERVERLTERVEDGPAKRRPDQPGGNL